MKYNSYLYARAFVESLSSASEGKYDDRVKRFVRLLEKNGDLNRSPKIIQDIRRLFVRKTGGNYVEIEFAHAVPRELESGIREVFSRNDYIKQSINPALAGGVRVTINSEEELDYSFARKIRKLFMRRMLI